LTEGGTPPSVCAAERSDVTAGGRQSATALGPHLHTTMPFALSPDREKIVDDIIARYPWKRAAALPVLHLCQEQLGWVSPDVIDYVARRLETSTAAIKGVVTFYTLFHQEPVAPNVVWVCRTLSCDLRGAKIIQEHLEQKLGCHIGDKSKDGKFTLMKAECLAACGQGPMIQLNDDYHENLTIKKVDEIIDRQAARTPMKKS